MNWDQFEGKWKQTKGAVREKWGNFTDDEIDRISGQREQLVGLIQERYGLAREAAERQADEWWRSAGVATKGADQAARKAGAHH